MRPVLFEFGPLPWWALPLLVVVLAAFLGLWSWLERREEPRPWTSGDWLVWAASSLISAGIIFWLVNWHHARTGQPVLIRAYGAMLLVGLVAGIAWAVYAGRPRGWGPTMMVDLALYLLVGGLLGARLIFVLLEPELFRASPGSMLRVWEGGLSFHGGLLGGGVGAYLFARIHRLSFLELADFAMPSVALGYAFTRIGCFLNGCCFGGLCDSALGVRFAPGSEAAAWGLSLPPGQVATTWGPPMYPTQLLMSFLGFVIFVLLVSLARHFPRAGHLFIFSLALFGAERFVAEFWRAGASARMFALIPALTEAQAFSLVMILFAVLYLVLARPRRVEG